MEFSEDILRCISLVVFDGFFSGRFDFAKTSWELNGSWNSAIGIVLFGFLLISSEKWLVEFYQFITGAVLLYFSIILQTTFVAACYDPTYASNAFAPEMLNQLFVTNFEITWLQKLILCNVLQVGIYQLFFCKYMYGTRTTKRLDKFGCAFSCASSFALLIPQRNKFIFLASTNIALLPQFVCLYMTVVGGLMNAKKSITDWVELSRVQIREIGVIDLVEHTWTRLRVLRVLKLFFIFRMTYIISLMLRKVPIDYSSDYQYQPIGFHYFLKGYFTSSTLLSTNSMLDWFSMSYNNKASTAFYNLVHPNKEICPIVMLNVKNFNMLEGLVVKLSDSFISIFSIGAIMFWPLFYLGLFVYKYIGGIDRTQATNVSVLTVCLFSLLSLQTGINSLPPCKRLQRMVVNSQLLSSSVLHYLHDLVGPYILQISQQVGISLRLHFPPLAFLWGLLGLSAYICLYLLRLNSFTTWVITIFLFSVELMVKILNTFVLYGFYTADTRMAHQPWPKLPDYIFCIKSASKVIEFILGIAMFLNGVYIFLFESWSFTRFIMMSMHVYINIYKTAKTGWTYIRHKFTISGKLKELALASEDILFRNKDEVCGICYCNFNPENGEVVETPCHHIFHSGCLRNWIYIKETCPMCHASLFTSFAT